MSQPNPNNNPNDELLSVVPGSQNEENQIREEYEEAKIQKENPEDVPPEINVEDQKKAPQQEMQGSTGEDNQTEDKNSDQILDSTLQEKLDHQNSESPSQQKKPGSLMSGAFSFLKGSKKPKTKPKPNKQSKADETSQTDVPIEEETPDQKMLKALKKEQKRIRGKKTYWKTLTNTICVLVLISSISVLAATLWLPFLKVYTNNMAPALNKDDIVMVVKQSHLEPGELIGFYYNNKLMIKRVIAKAGDVVNIDDNGVVYVNDTPLDEPYVNNQQKGDASIEFPYTVPEAQLFVLSDDRSNLLDSRNYAIQSIAEELILGKVTLRVWPLQGIRIF